MTQFAEILSYINGTYVRKITIDHTKISADITNFPCALQQTSSNFNFNGNCDAAGLSIIYTNNLNNGYLNFEREKYDDANQRASHHVLVPSVLSATDTVFYQHYKKETARWEQFVDKVHTHTESGVTWSINKPVKYGSNPFFGNAAWTWDRDLAYPAILTDPSWPAASRYRMWYQGTNATAVYNLCYAYAAEGADLSVGANWTKPNLGLVTYDGNTNNNILTPTGLDQYQSSPGGVYYDAITGIYVLQTGVANSGGAAVSANNIYTSTNPTGPWTLKKTLLIDTAVTTYAQHGHGMGITRRKDGKWVAYYQQFLVSIDTRQIGAFISDTVELDGAWTDIGVILPGVSTTDQRHDMTGRLIYGGIQYSTSTRAGSTYGGAQSLMVSRNGIDIAEKDTSWIPLGGAGTWEDAQMFGGVILEQGNEWWKFYVAAADQTVPYSRYFGIAKIGKMRIGQIARTTAGVGTFESKEINIAAVPLYVNAVATGASDTITAELIDATTGSVITNYANTDCTAFTGDSYSTEIMWGSNHFYNCPTKKVRIKFYLNKTTSDVKLHSYMLGAEADCLWDFSTPKKLWPTSYVNVQHMKDNDITGASDTSVLRSSHIVRCDDENSLVGDWKGTKIGAGNPTESTNIIGMAQTFNGTTSYATLPKEIEAYTAVEIQAKIKHSAISAAQCYVHKGTGGAGGGITDIVDNYRLAVTAGNQIIFIYGNADVANMRVFTLTAITLSNTTDYLIDVSMSWPTLTSIIIFVNGTKYTSANGTWTDGNGAGTTNYPTSPAPFTCTISAATSAVVTKTNHGVLSRATVSFTTTGALPAPLIVGKKYYAKYINANTFNLAYYQGGPNIDTSAGGGSGTHTCTAVNNVTNNSTVKIGNRYYNGYIQYFSGSMDELRILNAIRTDAERVADYHSLANTLVTYGIETFTLRIPRGIINFQNPGIM